MESTWTEIKTLEDVKYLTEAFHGFHDSILRESKYQSGAFVDEERRLVFQGAAHLRCTFQGQRSTLRAIEVVFIGVRRFQIISNPHDPIDCAGFLLGPDSVIWQEEPSGSGSFVASKTAIWRGRPSWMGVKDIYTAVSGEDEAYYGYEQL